VHAIDVIADCFCADTPDELKLRVQCMGLVEFTSPNAAAAFQSETFMEPDRRRKLWEGHREHHRLEGLEPRAIG
jgi:hypothetical protein